MREVDELLAVANDERVTLCNGEAGWTLLLMGADYGTFPSFLVALAAARRHLAVIDRVLEVIDSTA